MLHHTATHGRPIFIAVMFTEASHFSDVRGISWQCHVHGHLGFPRPCGQTPPTGAQPTEQPKAHTTKVNPRTNEARPRAHNGTQFLFQESWIPHRLLCDLCSVSVVYVFVMICCHCLFNEFRSHVAICLHSLSLSTSKWKGGKGNQKLYSTGQRCTLKQHNGTEAWKRIKKTMIRREKTQAATEVMTARKGTRSSVFAWMGTRRARPRELGQVLPCDALCPGLQLELHSSLMASNSPIPTPIHVDSTHDYWVHP